MILAGVDGCPGGWIAAVDRSGVVTVSVHRSFAALVAEARAGIIAVDMPIGLPARVGRGGRGPEVLARPLLGARQSSIFAVPARAAVEAPDYPTACLRALETSDPPRKVSKQCFHLFPKIREIDALLRATPGLIDRVREVHPELAFWRLNGDRPLALPKKVKSRPHPPGLDLRRGLLVASGIAPAVAWAPPPRGAGADDLLDALACLTVARRLARGEGRSLPDPPGRDAHGLPVALWM